MRDKLKNVSGCRIAEHGRESKSVSVWWWWGGGGGVVVPPSPLNDIVIMKRLYFFIQIIIIFAGELNILKLSWRKKKKNSINSILIKYSDQLYVYP